MGFTRTLAAIALASAFWGISGCGNSNRMKTKPLSRAELIARADAICKRAIAKVDWAKASPRQLPRVVDKLAALEERAAAELEQLTPPASMLQQWRLIVGGFKLTGPEFKQIADEITKSGVQAYPTLPLSNAQHERGLDANIAGVKGCVPY